MAVAVAKMTARFDGSKVGPPSNASTQHARLFNFPKEPEYVSVINCYVNEVQVLFRLNKEIGSKSGLVDDESGSFVCRKEE